MNKEKINKQKSLEKSDKTNKSDQEQIKKSSVNGLMFFINFILFSLLVCAFAYIYYWYHPKIRDTAKELTDITNKLSLLTQSNLENKNAIQKLSAQTKKNQQAINQAQDNFQQFGAQAFNEITTIKQRIFINQQKWLYADIHYLLKLATRRVNLASDTKGAIAALKIADKEIEKLNNSALSDIRKIILVTINRLSQVQEADTEKLMIALAKIKKQLVVTTSKKPGTFKEGQTNFEKIKFSGTFEEFIGQFIQIKQRNNIIVNQSEKALPIKVTLNKLALVEKLEQAVLSMDQGRFNDYLSKLIESVNQESLLKEVKALKTYKVDITIPSADQPLLIYEQFLTRFQQLIEEGQK